MPLDLTESGLFAFSCSAQPSIVSTPYSLNHLRCIHKCLYRYKELSGVVQTDRTLSLSLVMTELCLEWFCKFVIVVCVSSLNLTWYIILI